ncbi:hypothetical protein BZG36_05695 [Bifiguratus adelaidae]|uniref:Uncharacterized protein n=1 Tax=Bifiguratus adelaidae TaxID=1938954 RepID=A0A261XTX3_9FUNG|nr:hypothetical protein BZG36_05695 [Bifiguratus adelaidae]
MFCEDEETFSEEGILEYETVCRAMPIPEWLEKARREQHLTSDYIHDTVWSRLCTNDMFRALIGDNTLFIIKDREPRKYIMDLKDLMPK